MLNLVMLSFSVLSRFFILSALLAGPVTHGADQGARDQTGLCDKSFAQTLPRRTDLAEAKDAAQVLKIAEENHFLKVQDTSNGFLVGERDLHFYEDAISKKLIYVVRDGDKVVGFTLVCDIKDSFAADDRAEIEEAGLRNLVDGAPKLKWFVQTAISRSYLHSGFGSALQRHVESQFPESSFGSSIVESADIDKTHFSNQASASFRLKEGFERIGGLSYPYKKFKSMTVGIYLRSSAKAPTP